MGSNSGALARADLPPTITAQRRSLHMRIEFVVEFLFSLTPRETSPGAPASPFDVPPFNFCFITFFLRTRKQFRLTISYSNSCKCSQFRNKCCVKLVCLRRICSYKVSSCNIWKYNLRVGKEMLISCRPSVPVNLFSPPPYNIPVFLVQQCGLRLSPVFHRVQGVPYRTLGRSAKQNTRRQLRVLRILM